LWVIGVRRGLRVKERVDGVNEKSTWGSKDIGLMVKGEEK